MEIQVTKTKLLKRHPVEEHGLIRMWHNFEEFIFHTRFNKIKYRVQMQLWVRPPDYVRPGHTVVDQKGMVWFCVATYPLSIVVDLVELIEDATTTPVIERLLVISQSHPENNG